jgi:hypothetical protein
LMPVYLSAQTASCVDNLFSMSDMIIERERFRIVVNSASG